MNKNQLVFLCKLCLIVQFFRLTLHALKCEHIGTQSPTCFDTS